MNARKASAWVALLTLLQATPVFAEEPCEESVASVGGTESAFALMDQLMPLMHELRLKPARAEPLASFYAGKERDARQRREFRECLERIGKSYAHSLKYANHVRFESGAPTYGLTDEERVALLLYSYDSYIQVNQALRKGGADQERVQPFVDTLTSALDKLADHRGEVLRGVDSLPPEIFEQHRPGQIVTYPAFTSTHAAGTRFGLGLRKKIKLHIQSLHGKYIADYSASEAEREVLFRPGTRFRVTSREETDEGLQISMEELE